MNNSMPSATSQEDSRKGKPGLSCAECRRSKLKCDRNFPCQSCIRRGCAAICPNGTLAATKGNKVLMAHAQRLAEQVRAMSARIKQLEDALAEAQNGPLPFAALGDEPAPQSSLQDGEQSDVKYEGDIGSVSKSLGSLAIDGEGKAQYYGETAGAEYLQHLMPTEIEAGNTSTIKEPKDLGLPYEILELVYAFPFGVTDRAHLIVDFANYIPFRDRAIGLADLYYTHAAWMFDPVPRGDFENSILEPLYSSASATVSLVDFEPHRLAVFFMVLGTGALFDCHPSARMAAEQYHAIACAAFALESIVGGATCASIQALLMMAHFLFLTDRSGNERRWLLSGLCNKVIHMLGLQRDSAGWNLSEEEIQRRRTIFWEYYTWECWVCVIHGRPPSSNLTHSDCRFPRDLAPYLLPSGNSELSFHSWKHHYSAVCLSVSVQRAFSVRRASYSSLLELDKRIRSFPVPAHLLCPAHETGSQDWDTNPSSAMQQFFTACERESTLVYIHRSWFAEALRDSTDPLQHEYGQSVVSIYRSANIMINGLRSLTGTHPRVAGRVWFFWSSFYTSSVLLGAIVVKSPGCKLARSALALLDQSLAVYEEGSTLCRPPATVPMLEKLHRRAHHTYATFCSSRGCGGPPSLPLSNDLHDLSAFGGTKGVVISKSPPSSPRGSDAPSPDSSLSAVSGDIPANSAVRQQHSPTSLPRRPSPLAYSSGGSSPPHPHPHLSDTTQAMSQILAGSVPGPGPVQQSQQFGLPYATEQDTPRALDLDFQPPPLFMPLDPCLESGPGYTSSSDGAQFPPSQESAQQQLQNPLASSSQTEEILDLDFDFEALGLGLPPMPQQQQQPMQYSQYPQLQQFQDDIFMGEGTSQPAQIPQDDVWWKFVDDLGIQRI